ncbi:HD domain-containing phosphohydrolase [Glaciecola siphonariae]|uniref:HD domain-containing phosphohydrolase n=1 Tax=Glaciecola siphonariae TaxID=521012 RepID=A0ABV9M1P2_9ALTE
MALFIPEELESDILHDLSEEIQELYEASEQTLIELELTPNDNELQRSLFRSVHTIKGDLGLVGFMPMIEVLQYLEDILDLLRKGEATYTSVLSDLVLKLMDRVTRFVSDCINDGRANYDKEALDATIDVIKLINAENSTQHEQLLQRAINCLTNQQDNVDSAPRIELAKTGIPKDLSPDKMADLLFFRELMRPIEKRTGYKEGRGDRLAILAFYINSLSDEPLPEEQLAVACYVHDFGMAFMPNHVVMKGEELTKLESNLLRSHVYKSTRLIEHLNTWDEARKIIMQHHENVDGSGYPLGITGDQMCAGAKLLAILDRYDNLTNTPQADGKCLTSKEAIIALNQQHKGQLSGNWLRLFNQGMTQLLKQESA